MVVCILCSSLYILDDNALMEICETKSKSYLILFKTKKKFYT